MPRPTRKKIEGPAGGRPIKPIDWDEVDKLLMAGCNGVQVAAYLHMHPHTFYDRVQIEKGTSFTEYQTEKKEKGNTLLLGAQYKLALERDRTMLIWLGKQRLGQKEEPKGADTFNGELKEFIEFLKQKYEKKEETKTIEVKKDE